MYAFRNGYLHQITVRAWSVRRKRLGAFPATVCNSNAGGVNKKYLVGFGVRRQQAFSRTGPLLSDVS